MSELTQNTEEKILLAAENVFMRDGYDGSRMQAIADEAGINKALLHYYFRSKDLLFEKVFDQKVQQFFPDINHIIFDEKIDFVEKVCLFVEKYIHLLTAYPYLPLFIVSTVNKVENQGFIKKVPFQIYQALGLAYHADLSKNKVKEINIFQFILSVTSMCVFPLLARPIIKENLKLDDVQFNEFLEQRITEVQSYVRFILKP